MSDAPVISITEDSILRCLSVYAGQQALRGKGLAETAAKIMRLWVGEALENIPPGDKTNVESYLMREVTTYRREVEAANSSKKAAKQAAQANKYRHTIAARIVGALNIYGARGKPAGEYYQKVNLWVQRRIFAVNLHRAGLLPARKVLKVRDNRGNAKIKSAPGDITETVRDQVASVLVENWASSSKTKTNPRPKGIAGLAGGAFEDGIEGMHRTLTAYVLEDLAKAAKKSGFTASS